ncbi:hypothetical protein [uncultured Enterovirga sp.]|uniref:hypothetical protein n=1 Tax=uncultured Enterovirga sp. TaxID=2026352 RepID=UPI0035CA5912
MLARQDTKFGSRQVRVPLDAFVPIAPRMLPPPSRAQLMLEGPAEGANDNASPLPVPATRSLLREIIFLLIFAATLAGTYYIGRLTSAVTVISVPGPTSDHSRVT